MEDLKLYIVSDEYIDYLRDNVSVHVFSNSGENYSHTRKYLGVVVKIDNYRYYVPMSSPKQSDYIIVDGQKKIRKSIIPIMRITESHKDGETTLLGTLKFNAMIPVPNSELTLYDLDNEKDLLYKDLVEKEVRFINRHTADVLKHAIVIYKQKISNQPIRYLQSTLDFKLLENVHDSYNGIKNFDE